MKVRALERGYDGVIREPGDVFECPLVNGQPVMALWYELADEKVPPRPILKPARSKNEDI